MLAPSLNKNLTAFLTEVNCNMKKFLLCAALAIPGLALASQSDALPTCYGPKIPASTAGVGTELFVAIDQTTPLDMALKQSIADNIKPFLQGSMAFSIFQFSAFTQGRYTELLASASFDNQLNPATRNEVPKAELSKFDRCISQQPAIGAKFVVNAIKIAFSGTSTVIDKSDVLASLKDISSRVRQSRARNKVVLVASDMLENSSISSFYVKQAVRKIDPDKELKLVADNQLFADFGGARVYVIGAGSLADDAKNAKGLYRDPKTMLALKTFWQNYFQKSNAQLVEFGQPALLNPVR